MILTPEQIEGIRLHEIEFKRLVDIVNEKYKTKQREKDLRYEKEGQSNQAKKQTR
jgi:hypothetical protein